eukprot:gene3211-13145_t
MGEEHDEGTRAPHTIARAGACAVGAPRQWVFAL